MPNDATFKFIDLCAGIGGLRIPFDGDFDGLKGSCVFTSEKDQAARSTYAANFKDGDKSSAELEALIDRDFTEAAKTPHQIPNHDLLLAGFPCQPFSHAGKKKGFDDTRGTLFFSIAEIVRAKQPRVVLLENVRGLKSHDKGNTLKRIIEILRDDLGYYVPEPKVLNARDFGLAQNRTRLFIVAIRKDLESLGPFDWPEPTHDRDLLRVKNFLDAEVDAKYTISDRLWKGHQERKIRNQKAGKGWGYQLFNPEDQYVATISARYFKDGSEALIEQPGMNPRKLTPEEIRRLQGFPKGFQLNTSNIQAYKQLGNAVPINVITAIAGKLSKYLSGEFPRG
jgi:DNA (cytosine-5)-methyltransferase 1